MKTAFLSEFITSKNVLMQSVVIYVVVSLVIGVSMQSPMAMVACIGAMTPFLMVFTFCALDGMNGWERFRATLPVSRAAIVASRYANVLFASVFVLFLGWAVALALSAAVSVLPQAVSPAQSRPSSSVSIRFFMCVTSFAYIIQESRGVVKHRVNVVILQGRSLKAGGCVRAESVSLVNYLHMCSRRGEPCSPTKRKSLILSFVPHKKGCSL